MRSALLLGIVAVVLVLALHPHSPVGFATFGVSFVPLQVSADWEGFIQKAIATPGGDPVPLEVNGTYHYNGSRSVTLRIDDAFLEGYSFSVHENGMSMPTVRTADVLSWNASAPSNLTIHFLVDPPSLHEISLSETPGYLKVLVVNASTPLREATFTTTVQPSYTGWQLFEGSIDRTVEYALDVSGGTASFTVPFTVQNLTRNLSITAQPKRSTNGGGGGGATIREASITSNFPNVIEAFPGEIAGSTGTLTHSGARPLSVALSSNDSELTLDPADLHLSSGASAMVALTFSPAENSLPHSRWAQVSIDDGTAVTVVKILLVVLERVELESPSVLADDLPFLVEAPEDAPTMVGGRVFTTLELFIAAIAIMIGLLPLAWIEMQKLLRH